MEATLPPYVVNEVSPTMSMSQSKDWGIDKLKIEELHKAGLTGKGIKVAVLDTGVEDHQDLKGAITYRSEHVRDSSTFGKNGHGTAVAGVIGARNNDTGVVGVAPECEILAIKVLSESGSGGINGIVAGINEAISRGANVINMSLGTHSPDGSLHQAVRKANRAGIIVVCAAGNDGSDNSINYPGRYDETFAIGAINQHGEISSFSSRGPQIDIAAPGEQILTTWRHNTYSKVSGTSFAAPYVSGIFALMLQAGVKIEHDVVKLTAIDIAEKGFDHSSGWGMINPQGLLAKKGSTSTVIDEKQLLKEALEHTIKAMNILKAVTQPK